jgi:putative protease
LSRIFYEKHGAEVNEKAFELLNKTQQDGKTIMTTRYCIKYELQICPHKQKPNPSLQIKEPIFLKDKNRRYRLDFDCEQCFMKVLLED